MGRGQEREGRDMLNNTSHPRSKSIRVKFGVGMDDGGDSGCEVKAGRTGQRRAVIAMCCWKTEMLKLLYSKKKKNSV